MLGLVKLIEDENRTVDGRGTAMNAKLKAVLERVERLEDQIAKGREYLETGAHAEWHGFRPLFAVKARGGTALPPHPDWVRNVFLPRREMALRQAEKLLEKLQSTDD